MAREERACLLVSTRVGRQTRVGDEEAERRKAERAEETHRLREAHSSYVQQLQLQKAEETRRLWETHSRFLQQLQEAALVGAPVDPASLFMEGGRGGSSRWPF